LPIIKLTKAGFPLIDWRAVTAHIAEQYVQVETVLSLFTKDTANGWMAEVVPPDGRHGSARAIECTFWLDPRTRRKRPSLTDPDRAAYITRRERKFLDEFMRTITSQPWLNLKTVWMKSEQPGLIAVHFKVYDYEPFLKDKTPAPTE